MANNNNNNNNNNNLLSYFYDASAKKPLIQDDKGNYTLDFGEQAQKNPPIAGETSISTVVYVQNDHDYPLELRPSVLDKDLSITEYPEFLEPGEIGLARFTFAPSADRIRPLEGGSWDFTKIVYTKV
jgi:hypothetical protein